VIISIIIIIITIRITIIIVITRILEKFEKEKEYTTLMIPNEPNQI
jgi:hypothetical protein